MAIIYGNGFNKKCKSPICNHITASYFKECPQLFRKKMVNMIIPDTLLKITFDKNALYLSNRLKCSSFKQELPYHSFLL
jgi:hypothetical protein